LAGVTNADSDDDRSFTALIAITSEEVYDARLSAKATSLLFHRYRKFGTPPPKGGEQRSGEGGHGPPETPSRLR
jgi:hypothetical protein